MRLGAWTVLALAGLLVGCSLPKFRGAGGGDDEGPMDAGGDGHGGSGHDEDSDGIPDLADTCPTDPNTAINDDADGDEIGVGCDPNPGSPDERFLYTFESGTGDLETAGPTDQGDDAITIGNATNGVRQLLWVPGTFSRVHIELGYHVYAIGDGTAAGVNFEELTLHTSHTGTAGSLDGEGCSVERLLQAAETHFYVESVDTSGNGTEHAFMDLPGEPSVDSDGRLILDEVAGNLVCTLVRDGHPAVRIMQNIGSNTGQVGFSAIQMRVGIKYLFVAGR